MVSIKKEIGLTDTLNGLIATISKKLYELYGETRGFKDGEFMDGVHALFIDPRFKDSGLKDLDFKRVGGDRWYSRGIECHLFLGGAYGGHDFIDWGRICLYPKRYEKRLEKFRNEFGEETVSTLEQMAETFVKYYADRTQ